MGLAIQYIVNGIIAGIAYAVLTIGYSLIYSTTKIFHLAHAAVFAFSGLIAWFLCTQGFPIWLAVPATIVLGAMFGAVMELGIYRPLRRRGATVLIVMIASLGILIITQNLLTLFFSPNVQFFPVDFGSILVGPIIIPGWQVVSLILAIVFILALVFVLQRTRIGEEIHAVASNELMSRVIAININRVYLITIVLGSMMAALAGVMVAVDTGANSYSGLIQLLTAFVIMILGGVGNIKGIIGISFLFGLLENLTLLVVPSEWKTTITFATFIVLVLLQANSLTGAHEKKGGAV